MTMLDVAPVVLLPAHTIPQVRFSDTDMMGHISSMSYAAWAEVGRADFFEAIPVPLAEKPWFVLVKLTLEFHSEGRFGEKFAIATQCARLGTKSMTLVQHITVAERPVCSLEVVMAAFDPKTRRAIPVPTSWRVPPETASI
jgi:acyl-CoA thioester hydrolase